MRVVRREPADPVPPVEHHAPQCGERRPQRAPEGLDGMERHANSGKERRSAASSIKLRLMSGGAGSGGEPDKAGANSEE